jgi:hypothetical protein
MALIKIATLLLLEVDRMNPHTHNIIFILSSHLLGFPTWHFPEGSKLYVQSNDFPTLTTSYQTMNTSSENFPASSDVYNVCTFISVLHTKFSMRCLNTGQNFSEKCYQYGY